MLDLNRLQSDKLIYSSGPTCSRRGDSGPWCSVDVISAEGLSPLARGCMGRLPQVSVAMRVNALPNLQIVRTSVWGLGLVGLALLRQGCWPFTVILGRLASP